MNPRIGRARALEKFILVVMTKKLIGSALALLAFAPVAAFASVDFDNVAPVVFDNGNGWESSVDGNAGESFKAKVILDVTSDDDVNAVSFDKVGDFIPQECVQFDEVQQSVSNLPVEFDMTFPSAFGSHDYVFKVYGVNGAGQDFNCSDSNVVDTVNVTDQIITNIGNSNTSGNTGGGSGTVGNSAIAQLQALVASLAKQVGDLINKPTTPPAASGKCAALASKTIGAMYGTRNSANIVLQGFLLSEGQSIPALAAGASFGFWGPETNSALMNFKAANQCM
jgi:hypothetical protein